jgi:hypothetical protein
MVQIVKDTLILAIEQGSIVPPGALIVLTCRLKETVGAVQKSVDVVGVDLADLLLESFSPYLFLQFII